MNKWTIIILAILILPTALAGREFPTEVYEQARVPVSFTLEGTTIGERVVLAEKIPQDAQLIEWKVNGGEQVKYIEHEEEHIFSFVATSQEPKVTYLIEMPQGERAAFDAVYAMPPNNFGRITDTLRLQGLSIVEPQEEKPTNQEQKLQEEEQSSSWIAILLASLIVGSAAGSFYLYESRHEEPIRGREIHDSEAVNANSQAQMQRYDEAEFTSSWQQQEWDSSQKAQSNSEWSER